MTERRRTGRTNVGVPPDRYGLGVDTISTKRKPSASIREINANDNMSIAASSRKSKSSGSTVKSLRSEQRRIDQETEEEIIKLDEVAITRKRDYQLKVGREEVLRIKSNQLYLKLQNADLPQDEKNELQSKKDKIEEEWDQLKQELITDKIHLTYQDEADELKRKELLSKAKYSKEVIEDEIDSEEEKENVEPVDNSLTTAEWAENVAANSPSIVPVSEPSAEEKLLLQSLVKWGTGWMPTTEPAPVSAPQASNLHQFFDWTPSPVIPSFPLNFTSQPTAGSSSAMSTTPWPTPFIPPLIAPTTTSWSSVGAPPPPPPLSAAPPVPPLTRSITPSVPVSLEVPTSIPTSIPSSTVPTTTVPTPQFASTIYPRLEQVVQEMVSRFTPPQPTPNSSTDRILARQVQGRDLPTFTGRPEEWPAFYVAFANSTNFCQFSNAENLIRLQRCLKGDALKMVQCLLVAPDSVPMVLEKLRMRYGRPDQIIENLIQKARDLPNARIDKLDTLIDLGIMVDNLAATIKGLNSLEHLNNPMLIKELVSKLPSANQLEWARQLQASNKAHATIDYFAQWLTGLTNAACSLCPPKSSKFEEKTGDRQRGRNRQDDRILVAAEEPKSRNRNQKQFAKGNCSVCSKSGHKVVTCDTFLKMDGDGRWKAVKEKKLCFACLNYGHSSQECRSKKTCGKDGCQRSHHQLLHQLQKREDNRSPPTTEQKSQEDTMNYVREIPFINLMVLPVKLEGPKGTVSTYLMLDNGATLSAMEESIATRLGLEGYRKDIKFSAFQTDPMVVKSRTVSLKIMSQDESFSYNIENVRTIQGLGLRKQSVRRSVVEKWSHLRNIKLETYEDEMPGILIGSDNPSLQLQLEHRIGNGNAPVAVRTPLGWALMGRTTWSSNEQNCYSINEMENDALHQLVKNQFTTESFGVKPLLEKPRTKEDKRAQSILDQSIRRVDGGWEVGLLWKEDTVKLPESYKTSYRRLMTMEKKMDADKEFANQYLLKIQEYIDKGYARKLSTEEAALTTEKTYYLPHFMAINPKKPGKLRFVFDAAAKNQGQSLNDHLLRGPDKMVSLPGTLLRFRKKKVGMTADIADMFHRVKVKPEDTEAQRFLWRGLDRDRAPDNYIMNVLIFGATCSPTCAQEVKNINASEFQEDFPEACKSIVKNHYVDDLLDSCDTLEEAMKRYEDIRMIQLAGGFNLRNWLSSSKELMEYIPEELRASNMKDLSIGEDSVIERVLGMFWKPESDCFTFSLNFIKACEEVLEGKKIPTKRQVLSLVMSIYDPLGFLAVLTIKAKMLLQAIWKTKIGWDDEIPASIFQGWVKWLDLLKKIPEFELSRCYSLNLSTADDIQLHIFVDGSEEAFGAVAYLRTQKGKSVETALVMAKAKVAPIKVLTIPRMELQAAVLGCRIAEFIQKELDIKINRTVYHSDSTSVLGCLVKEDGVSFKTFVANRVGEIQSYTNSDQWRWVPTADNVADDLTRFKSPCDWSPSSRWLIGPSFLLQDESQWPVQKWNHKQLPEDEIKKNVVFQINQEEPRIDPTKYSSWTRLIRVTAYVLRFVTKTRKLAKSFTTELTPEEIENSQLWWYKIAQQESFPEEYEILKKGGQVSKSSKLKKLCPYIDNGVIRVRGRIDNATISISTRRPAVLDPKHPITGLLIQYYHRLCGHHGTERILNEIRQIYYVPHLRSAVKKAQHLCLQCRHSKTNPTNPEMAQLPQYRLESHVFPFNRTGMDYFGPIEVVVKRSREKRYGVLFTCLSTRAVHLEVAHSLSTDSCILAIRRFIGRRGCPSHIYSDNGTNFHGTKNELEKALKEVNQEKMESECTSRGISWHFNPPAAPHMGGSWERMVRSVKIALGETLKKKNLHDEVLYTLMVEAEHSVNGHPLTHVSIDPDDQEALTPNHFLIGRSSNYQPIGKFDQSDLYGRKQWRIVQELANQFWRRWIREFLPTLLRREKWCQPTHPIQIGDVVLEVNESLARNHWPKGIVTKMFPGPDGVTRVVDIRLANGNTYRRPVAKLCVLDVHAPAPPEKTP